MCSSDLMARHQQHADRQLGDPGYSIGRERDTAGARPVDHDAAEGQQGDTRQHPADQDDRQPYRRAGLGHDGESERGRADGVTERVDDAPGKQDFRQDAEGADLDKAKFLAYEKATAR